MTELQDSDSVSDCPGSDVVTVVWPPVNRILFRFVFVYVVLFLGSFSGGYAPLSLPIIYLFGALWSGIIPWVANSILQVPPLPVHSDGDGLGHWIMMVGCGVLAVVATLI
ncbi:hypothetical protein N9C83_04725 [Opitutales bacterium]|nr:hypothetical protein [Opitutales bacterium]